MTSTIRYLKKVYQRTKLDRPVPAYSELAFDYLYIEAKNRLTEVFGATAKQSETETQNQEIIVPHEDSSARFPPPGDCCDQK
jgi:hypothetical protein